MKLRIAAVALLLGSTALAPAHAQSMRHRATRPATAAPTAPTLPATQALPIIPIDYQRVVLPNGLTLIVHEDHKVPVVSVATYYHVGSANETAGRTGFAHLFEHLMFNGSEHANDDWFKFMNEIGATGMNGSTGNDRTNYFQTVPKAGLDLVLWYESDRMGNLLPAVDQAKLDEQRKVVQNEKRQRGNSPLGELPDMLYASTYPVGHPYSWTPIGSMEDLNAATLDDVKSFFRKWYGAGNAVLVLSGDITLAEAREKVEKYYGNIPGGPLLKRNTAQIAKMATNGRGELQAAIANPQVMKVWNVPGWSDPDTQLLRLAASALAAGPNSPLEKHLVREQQLASEVDVDVNALELGSQVIVSATARPGVPIEKLEAALDAELAAFLKNGPTSEELERIKFQRYAGMVRGQSSTMAIAQTLAEAELYAGTPEFYKTRQQINNAATPASVLAAARKWLSDGVYTITAVPKEAYKVTNKEVDRTAKPAIGKTPPFSLPPLQQATLSNGIKVMLAERHDVPTVAMSMMFGVGNLPDRDLAHQGFSNAIGLAMSGTTTRNELQISQRQEELGASIGWQGSQELSRFGMNALRIRLDESLDLYADILLHPTFPKDEWDRKLALFNANFEENKKTPAGKTGLIYGKLLYGANHPYAAAMTPEIARKLTIEDFKAFYAKWIRPDTATLLIVGDTTLEEILPKLEQRLKDWKATGPAPTKPALPAPERPTGPRVILVDQPGAESTLVQVAETGPARNAPDYDELNVVNTIMGGNFVSRLNLNLREDKGWSYGAKSSLGDAPLLGTLGAGAAVQTDKTADAMREIDRELQEIGTTRKPSPKEITIAKNAMLLGMSADLQDPSGALNLYRDAWQYHLPDNYWNAYVAKIEGLTPDTIEAAATRLYRPNELTWFVVGDLSKIEADVRKLNLGEVMVYDADGNRIR